MPYDFAENGALIGAVVGAITIKILAKRRLKSQIVSLYKRGVKKPEDISRVLGRNERQVERLLTPLCICKSV